MWSEEQTGAHMRRLVLSKFKKRKQAGTYYLRHGSWNLSHFHACKCVSHLPFPASHGSLSSSRVNEVTADLEPCNSASGTVLTRNSDHTGESRRSQEQKGREVPGTQQQRHQPRPPLKASHFPLYRMTSQMSNFNRKRNCSHRALLSRLELWN